MESWGLKQGIYDRLVLLSSYHRVTKYKQMMNITGFHLSKNLSRKKTALAADFSPSMYDVICGRGKECYNHVGNRRFRVSIEMVLDKYTRAETKTEKSLIVMTLVDKIRSNCGPSGGGFIRFDRKTNRWYEIGDEAAREKVGQTLRETMTQHDPAKRAKKRMQRAMNRAKKMVTEGPSSRTTQQMDWNIDQANPITSLIVVPPKANPITSRSLLDDDDDENHPTSLQQGQTDGTKELARLYQRLNLPEPVPMLRKDNEIDMSDADAVLAALPPELALESSRMWFTEKERQAEIAPPRRDDALSSDDDEDESSLEDVFEAYPTMKCYQEGCESLSSVDCQNLGCSSALAA